MVVHDARTDGIKWYVEDDRIRHVCRWSCQKILNHSEFYFPDCNSSFTRASSSILETIKYIIKNDIYVFEIHNNSTFKIYEVNLLKPKTYIMYHQF